MAWWANISTLTTMGLRGSNVPEEFRNGPHQSNRLTRWYLNGKLHREDGPASIWADGTKCWCYHGAFHRTDGPAIEYVDGHTSWYLHGKYLKFDEWLHRNNELTAEEKVMVKLQYG